MKLKNETKRSTPLYKVNLPVKKKKKKKKKKITENLVISHIQSSFFS
jgi:hypothetical protein